VKVVFDTNILISALVLPGSRADEALLRIIDGTDELILSKPILDELLGVLARKFARDADQLSRIALFLDDLASLVRPRRRLSVLDDDPDNRVIECALTGKAEAIVTGDKKMLRLASYQTVPIISLKEYLDG
jgi:putative PIN family toxin of toxin-antitoxin system